MPRALAYLYHHILGAFWVSSGKYQEASNLLLIKVCNPNLDHPCKLWQDHGLLGWVESLKRNMYKSWDFLCTFYDSNPWMHEFFVSSKAYLVSLRAYVFLASIIELADFVGKMGMDRTIDMGVYLEVPPTFLISNVNDASLDDLISKVIPDRLSLNQIATTGGADPDTMRREWPNWIKAWCNTLGSRNVHMAVKLRFYLENPPILP